MLVVRDPADHRLRSRRAFYVTATAGLLDLGSIDGSPALVIAAALAALAALFTDQVLEKMRGMLGLLPFHEPASGQEPATPR